ncbi:type VII secretion-associated serine protease mycosin [Winogradskya humida]|nr:type VII secretion-associated serine protease mycosin [Actinoplanes humidus]
MSRAAVAVTALVAGVLIPAGPAQAKGGPAQAKAFVCQQQVQAGQNSKAVPYETALFAPDRLAPFATGKGIRVAVLDSGVDDSNPQLDGQVDRGKDFLHNNSDARQDCIGHGTEVASIIAAKPSAAAGLRGLAPDATIVPVRVSEQTDTANGGTSGEPASPAVFAQAIRWAASPSGGDADVINMSLVMTGKSDAVMAAVSDVIAQGVVVVAAVGNHATDGNPDPYPAALPGVIGVGSIDATGVKSDFSQHGTYVDVMAPGRDVTVATPRTGQRSDSGTSFATPYVSATAALVKQRFPALSPAQISRRILATADAAPGGAKSDEYGAGILNPYRALTETLGPDTPPTPPAKVMIIQDPAALALAQRRADAQDRAMLFAAIGAGSVVLVVLIAAAIRKGRRRGWRPGDPTAPAEENPFDSRTLESTR